MWDRYIIKDKDILNKVLRRGASFVCNGYRVDCSATEMLESLGWDSLENRRRKSRINRVGRIVGVRMTINFEDYLFSRNARTRATDRAKLRTIGLKTNIYENLFFPRTISVWNHTRDVGVAQSAAHCCSLSPERLIDA